MATERFVPTDEQSTVIKHDASAFVSACPGAGKTRVLVERARLLLKHGTAGRGVAFLSFTKAAASELSDRLREERLLPAPEFPHFLGTFDSFLWQFFVAPFGVPGSGIPPRLIPDKTERAIRPFPGAREVPLVCFDRETGKILPERAKRRGFQPRPAQAKAYQTSARSAHEGFRERGELDFDDLRAAALTRLTDPSSSSTLQVALAGRFAEVIVDEAQDCNSEDLKIIRWLREGGIATKVVCDPHQSIYGFRGGVAEGLIRFGRTFQKRNRLSLRGNFRSSEPICRAIAAFRPQHARDAVDRSLGPHRSITIPVHILAYPGRGVPSSIGETFRGLLDEHGIPQPSSPVLAATWDSAKKAAGLPAGPATRDLTLQVAEAVTQFHVGPDPGHRREALEAAHRIVLRIQGRLERRTYHQYLADEGIEPSMWRPQVLQLLRDLRYDPSEGTSAEEWHSRAKTRLASYLPPQSPRTISQLLRRNAALPEALQAAPVSDVPAKSIHSVKGREFPAVCVVMTTRTASSIVDYLETGSPETVSEEARKLYVGVSRAQKLLAMALPKSQAKRVEELCRASGATVRMVDL